MAKNSGVGNRKLPVKRGENHPPPAILSQSIPLSPEEQRSKKVKTLALWTIAGGAFMFSIAMMQINEFAIAEGALSVSLVASIYEIGKWRISSIKLAAYFVAVGFFGFWAIDTFKIKADKPWSNIFTTTQKREFNSDFSVVKYVRAPYEVGKNVIVNMDMRYDGDLPAHFTDFYVINFAGGMTDAQVTPDGIAEIEDKFWNDFVKTINSNAATKMSIAPKSNTWMTLFGPVLNADMVRDLSTHNGAAIFIMGILRWKDGEGEYDTEFCAVNQSNPDIFVLCRDHNGPVKMSSAER